MAYIGKHLESKIKKFIIIHQEHVNTISHALKCIQKDRLKYMLKICIKEGVLRHYSKE